MRDNVPSEISVKTDSDQTAHAFNLIPVFLGAVLIGKDPNKYQSTESVDGAAYLKFSRALELMGFTLKLKKKPYINNILISL